MIVSSGHLRQAMGAGTPTRMDEGRRADRCSMEVLTPPSLAGSPPSVSATATLPLTHAAATATHASSLTVMPSTSMSEEDDDDLSSPASSGYGRSATSELEMEGEGPVAEPVNSDTMTSSTPFHPFQQRSKRLMRKREKEYCRQQYDGDEEEEMRRSPRARHPVLSSVVGRLFAEDDLEVLESLGEGFFSVVDKVRVRNSAEIFVRKVAKTGVRGERRATHADVAREAGMLRRVQHDNVLALRGLCITRGDNGEWDLHLLVDYCDGGSLSRLLLDQSASLPWSRRLSYALDMARGMAHIHDCRVIHRDLTSMNVLIQYSARSTGDAGCWGRVVIADFGLSCDFPRPGQKLPQVGTTYFMSPECLKEQYYDEKSDVFSFGIILCQLIARIDADPDYGLHRTADFGLNYVLFTSYCPPDTPIGLLTLAFSCCLMDPSPRPPFPVILEELSKLSALCAAVEAANAAAAPSQGSSDDLSPGRLERSRSDAALRRPRAVHQRKISAFRATGRTLTEGVVENFSPAADASASTRGASARGTRTRRGTPLCATPSNAAQLPLATPRTANPFASHARFRSARKIVAPRDEDDRSGRADGRDADEADGAVRRRQRRLIRRCSSLPSEMDSPSLDWPSSSDDYSDLDDDCTTAPSASAILRRADDAAGGCGTGGGAGAIPMAFREYDQKFLRQSKRFSRRYTMIAAASTSASTTTPAASASVCDPPADDLPHIKASDGRSSSSNNNNYGECAVDADFGPLPEGSSLPTKYSSWPKRRESRCVRADADADDARGAYGICRSRNAPGARAACTIL